MWLKYIFFLTYLFSFHFYLSCTNYRPEHFNSSNCKFPSSALTQPHDSTISSQPHPSATVPPYVRSSPATGTPRAAASRARTHSRRTQSERRHRPLRIHISKRSFGAATRATLPTHCILTPYCRSDIARFDSAVIATDWLLSLSCLCSGWWCDCFRSCFHFFAR